MTADGGAQRHAGRRADRRSQQPLGAAHHALGRGSRTGEDHERADRRPVPPLGGDQQTDRHGQAGGDRGLQRLAEVGREPAVRFVILGGILVVAVRLVVAALLLRSGRASCLAKLRDDLVEFVFVEVGTAGAVHRALTQSLGSQRRVQNQIVQTQRRFVVGVAELTVDRQFRLAQPEDAPPEPAPPPAVDAVVTVADHLLGRASNLSDPGDESVDGAT